MGEWLESFTSKMTQSPKKVLFFYVLERLKNGYTSIEQIAFPSSKEIPDFLLYSVLEFVYVMISYEIL